MRKKHIVVSLVGFLSFAVAVKSMASEKGNVYESWVFQIRGSGVVHLDAPVRFSKSLHINPHTLRSVHTKENADHLSWHVETPEGKTFDLKNPDQLRFLISPPIHLDALVTLSPKGTARIKKIAPNSVAAWNRLRTWKEVAIKVGEASIRDVDQSARKLDQIVNQSLKVSLDKAEQVDLIQKYQAFSRALGNAFENTKDFDVQRQLSAVISGARSERLAWQIYFDTFIDF